MEITYVTAFYKIYDDTLNNYVAHFIKFLEFGYTTILYLDSSLEEIKEQLSVYTNLTIITDVGFESLTVDKPTNLPSTRNQTKDTYKYLVLMNSKTDFVLRASKLSTTENLAWIDFGLTKLLKDPQSAYKKLIQVNIPESKILIPGCVENTNVNLDNVNWRFCGSLFFCNKFLIKSISASSKYKYPLFIII